jgi:hypothetical protein
MLATAAATTMITTETTITAFWPPLSPAPFFFCETDTAEPDVVGFFFLLDSYFPCAMIISALFWILLLGYSSFSGPLIYSVEFIISRSLTQIQLQLITTPTGEAGIIQRKKALP